MNYEDFEKYITSPLTQIQKELTNSQCKKQSDELFWKKITVSATIARTIRLTLKYPHLAEQYLNSLPRATMDENTQTNT